MTDIIPQRINIWTSMCSSLWKYSIIRFLSLHYKIGRKFREDTAHLTFADRFNEVSFVQSYEGAIADKNRLVACLFPFLHPLQVLLSLINSLMFS